MTKMTISQSKANRWNTCKASYNYRYNLNLRRRRVARPLTFGSVVHKVIEDTIKGVKNIRKSIDKWADEEISQRKYFSEEIQMFQETKNEAWDIMREYHEFWPANHIKYLEVNGTLAEHEIEWEPPGEDFIVTGKVDAYARSKNKLKWLVEHKSGRQVLSEEDRWRSIQTALYITVGRELGHPEVDGILWDMVISKTPTRPYLLQNGTFSLKKIDSLPSVIYDTISAAGQNPNDYPTLLADAEQNRSRWFQRVFQPVTEDVRKFLYGEFVGTAREILDHGETAHRMTVGKHCSWCDFEPICRARMTGDDVDYVMEKEYTVAEATSKADAKPVKKEKAVKPVRGRKPGRLKLAGKKGK